MYLHKKCCSAVLCRRALIHEHILLTQGGGGGGGGVHQSETTSAVSTQLHCTCTVYIATSCEVSVCHCEVETVGFQLRPSKHLGHCGEYFTFSESTEKLLIICFLKHLATQQAQVTTFTLQKLFAMHQKTFLNVKLTSGRVLLVLLHIVVVSLAVELSLVDAKMLPGVQSILTLDAGETLHVVDLWCVWVCRSGCVGVCLVGVWRL